MGDLEYFVVPILMVIAAIMGVIALSAAMLAIYGISALLISKSRDYKSKNDRIKSALDYIDTLDVDSRFKAIRTCQVKFDLSHEEALLKLKNEPDLVSEMIWLFDREAESRKFD